MKDVGLEAQTIGNTAGGSGHFIRLDERQLDQIAKLLRDLNQDMDRNRKSANIFERAARNGHLRPDTFVDIIDKELGSQAVRNHRVSEYTDLITAYLCDEKDFN